MSALPEVTPLDRHLHITRAKSGRPRKLEAVGAPDDCQDATPAPGLTGPFTAEQTLALRQAGQAYAQAQADLEKADMRAFTARYSGDPLEKLTALEQEQLAKVSKRQLLDARAGLRVTALDALNAETVKAGAAYRAACDATAFAAARLHALGTLRDELLNTAEFDPLGLFGRSFLLAPPEQYRPKGWATVSDCWGRACYFDGQSVGHADLVRKEKDDFRAALKTAMGDAPWPFEH